MSDFRAIQPSLIQRLVCRLAVPLAVLCGGALVAVLGYWVLSEDERYSCTEAGDASLRRMAATLSTSYPGGAALPDGSCSYGDGRFVGVDGEAVGEDMAGIEGALRNRFECGESRRKTEFARDEEGRVIRDVVELVFVTMSCRVGEDPASVRIIEDVGDSGAFLLEFEPRSWLDDLG